MEGLPSYEEATARPDWLQLVAPYLHFRDCRQLCLVNRHFWQVLAPRLWENPLKTVRLAGLDPSDDISWWFDFVFDKLKTARSTARSIVRVIDAAHFAKASYHFASDRHDKSLQLSFAKALELFPNTQSILLDGHTDLDPGFLINEKSVGRHTSPLLLSIANCAFELPGNFFASQLLAKLAYLDVSGIPGSVKALHRPGLLPSLRILKLRGREIDDASLTSLIHAYGSRIWSLDFSSNYVTDEVLPLLRDRCVSQLDLRSSDYFYIEGKLMHIEGGTKEFGPFIEVQESQWSSHYNHPERYFVDSPAYQANAELGVQEHHGLRASGCEKIRSDAADDVVRMLASRDDFLHLSVTSTPQGLTHLHLSNNLVSSTGLQRLIRTGNGQLQYLACDSMPFLVSRHIQNHWPRTSCLHGMVGAADLFRPVFSSNLRALRVHHSLVTGILDLTLEGFSRISRIYLAERVILPRIQDLYNGALLPDMNPRLTSLVLTGVPRKSSGPLINSLLNFLRLLSEQERAIQNVALSAKSSRRAPDLVSGLRHLRLEFEPDPTDEAYSPSGDLDAEDLMGSGEQGFSFFAGEQSKKVQVVVRHGNGPGLGENADPRAIDATHVSYEGEWEGKPFCCQVWLGPKQTAPNSALYRYQQLVREHGVTEGVGPASPSQLRAGAPAGSYLFHVAWMLAIMPAELRAPLKHDLESMQDVLDVLKRYRIQGRARFSSSKSTVGAEQIWLGEPHYFWTGKLEVSTEHRPSDGRTAQHWK